MSNLWTESGDPADAPALRGNLAGGDPPGLNGPGAKGTFAGDSGLLPLDTRRVLVQLLLGLGDI